MRCLNYQKHVARIGDRWNCWPLRAHERLRVGCIEDERDLFRERVTHAIAIICTELNIDNPS